MTGTTRVVFPDPTDSTRPELPLPETMLLWAMRTWVVGQRYDGLAKRHLGPVFEELGAPGATGYLEGLMWALDNGATRRIALRCPCHPRVGPDERLLLDVLALTQDRQGFERLLVLRSLLQPLAAMAVADSASGLVREINRAGLFLATAATPLRQLALPPSA